MRDIGIILIVFLMLALLTGCYTETSREYYESGQIKKETSREGFINWSDGNNKQMPFSNISLSVVGK